MKSGVKENNSIANTKTINHKNLYYPPGGILIWIIIFLELITFGIALVAMTLNAKEDPALFHNSRMQLNVELGTLNTVLLLSSGFFMASSVDALRRKMSLRAKSFLLYTILLGMFFLLVKYFEYKSKIEVGLTLGSNSFFTYYWLLTLFHLVHVIVGLIILGFFYFKIGNRNQPIQMEDIEAGAAFWHMCVLIWLLLFPVIYLIL